MDYDYAGEFLGAVRDEDVVFEGLYPRLGVDDVLDALVSLQTLFLDDGGPDGHVGVNDDFESGLHGLFVSRVTDATTD